MGAGEAVIRNLVVERMEGYEKEDKIFANGYSFVSAGRMR